MRRPFMIEPRQLASLEGQQYLVLRPAGPVADDYAATQSALLRTLPGSVTHPHTGHVTLRGFFEADRQQELKALIHE